tara:strand:- start:190 stop:603 length:414 start_codon:yes stop_codon:yes gene_type:complete
MSVELSRRVDWPMIDLAKVVYYPEYWDLAHRFFEESWEVICGINYPTIINKHRLGFPAVSTSSTHHSPLRYGDVVNCKIWVSKVGKSSTVWNYSFTNQTGRLIWTAEVTTVCVNLDSFESISIPENFLDALRKCGED